MTKLVVILGATGKQGGSVVEEFLKDTAFTARAVSRNTLSDEAERLRYKGVEVVRGDLGDLGSLREAFEGANVIYGMTTDFGINLERAQSSSSRRNILEQAYDIELDQGKNIIKAASTVPTLEKLVLSSLSAARRISGGKYSHVYHFDAKAAAVEFLVHNHPELASKTTVLQLGLSATNWGKPTTFRPTKVGIPGLTGTLMLTLQQQPNGRWRILAPVPADAKLPFIDPRADPAIFVKALASLPPSNDLKQYSGFGEMISLPEWAALLSQHLNIDVYFQPTTVDEWANTFTLVPGLGLELAEMYAYAAEFGYFGETKEDVTPMHTLTLDRAPTSMEEYIRNEDWSSLVGEEAAPRTLQ